MSRSTNSKSGSSNRPSYTNRRRFLGNVAAATAGVTIGSTILPGKLTAASNETSLTQASLVKPGDRAEQAYLSRNSSGKMSHTAPRGSFSVSAQ